MRLSRRPRGGEWCQAAIWLLPRRPVASGYSLGPDEPTMPADTFPPPTSRSLLRYTAFSIDPRGGNPAGVVLDARGLDAERMQTIAARLGDSETAFLAHVADDRYRVRYFSPLAE